MHFQKISIPTPKDGHEGVGVGVWRAKFLKESMKLNWKISAEGRKGKGINQIIILG